MKQMSREAFIEATKDVKWAKTEAFVDMLNAAGYWSWDFVAGAAEDRKKAFVRRMIRQLKADDGAPLFANVKTRDEDGSEAQVYKQEEMFDFGDYQQTVGYHASVSRDHYVTARGYKERGEQRYGGTIFLPDPTDDGQFGD